MPSVKIGIIGGSGLEDPDVLQNSKEKLVDTPFGKPSDSLILGQIKGVDCVLLSRHGRKHDINPTNVNYRANIWALKEEGCTHILVSNACGSLRENVVPGDIVFPDQFIDRTTKRASTFYDGGLNSPKGVCHIPMHTPFCPYTRKILIETAEELGYPHHESGTIVVIEGPRFSTRAESNLFRSWGANLVGMTTVPEVVLAKELGLCYASVCMATDYDCWQVEEEAVNVDCVMETFKQNAHKAKEILLNSIPKIQKMDWTSILKSYSDEVKTAVMV